MNYLLDNSFIQKSWRNYSYLFEPERIGIKFLGLCENNSMFPYPWYVVDPDNVWDVHFLHIGLALVTLLGVVMDDGRVVVVVGRITSLCCSHRQSSTRPWSSSSRSRYGRRGSSTSRARPLRTLTSAAAGQSLSTSGTPRGCGQRSAPLSLTSSPWHQWHILLMRKRT